MLHHAPHFRFCADADAYEARSNLSTSFTHQNSLGSQFVEKRRPVRTKIRKNKISCARKCFDSQSLIPARTIRAAARFSHITSYRAAFLKAASAATSAAVLTGKGGIARRKIESESRQAITAPSLNPASPAAFENVRATNK